MAQETNEEFNFDGNMHRIDLGEGISGTYVAERDTSAGMDLVYLRLSDGAISVYGHRPNGETTIASLLTDGSVAISNREVAAGLARDGKREQFARMIRALVDGAFPDDATHIVPLLERRSGTATDMLFLSARGMNDLDIGASGSGYTIVSKNGDFVFSRDSDEAAMFAMTLGAVSYDNPKVDNRFEQPLIDEMNQVPGTRSDDILELGRRIARDGGVDAQEAEEIGRAMDRVKLSVDNPVGATRT